MDILIFLIKIILIAIILWLTVPGFEIQYGFSEEEIKTVYSGIIFRKLFGE